MLARGSRPRQRCGPPRVVRIRRLLDGLDGECVSLGHEGYVGCPGPPATRYWFRMSNAALGTVVAIVPIATLYTMLVIASGSWTPLICEFRSPPPGYQSVSAFAAARAHSFPTLFEEPAPAPVAGTGYLVDIRDDSSYEVDVNGVAVKTLVIARLSGAALRAHVDVPLDPALLAHLRSLSKGAVVTVSGMGHGDGRHNVHIYPVHRVNGYEP